MGSWVGERCEEGERGRDRGEVVRGRDEVAVRVVEGLPEVGEVGNSGEVECLSEVGTRTTGWEGRGHGTAVD